MRTEQDAMKENVELALYNIEKKIKSRELYLEAELENQKKLKKERDRLLEMRNQFND
jgi:hypothetical protein